MIDVAPFVQSLKGKPAALFGLGISNRSVCAALQRAGGGYAAWDDDEGSRTRARAEGLVLDDLTGADMARYACLVVAPGVPPGHAVIRRAQAAGLELLCDMEILHRCLQGRRSIGITGTNGKSTTTALIGHILEECGVAAQVGGNIGRPVLDLDPPPPDGVFVLEMSSYQLDLCPSFAPDIAVLLNITPDHLEHHGSMENYIAAKEKIFRGKGDAIIAADDDICRAIISRVKARGERRVHEISARDPGIPAGPRLPGLHNRQNIAAAVAVARILSLSPPKVAASIASFPGLPHRQSLVRTLGGITFINDSKATNAQATAPALACYEDIYWIVGGRPKEGGLAGLEPYAKKIRQAFLIGESEAAFAAWMEKNGVPGGRCGTLEHAVTQAYNKARAAGRGAVLLSPACASFDQFRNFEHRGEVFTDLVNALEESA